MSYQDRLSELHRCSYGRLLGALYRQFRNLDDAEDALQDAFLRASELAVHERPQKPEAWIITVARNRLLDGARRSHRGRRVHETLKAELRARYDIPSEPRFGSAASSPAGPGNPTSDAGPLLVPDDELRLMFLCAHPALSEDVRLVLMLKLVAGLSVPAIASALLRKPASVAQAISRAKQKVRDAAIPFEVPDTPYIEERIDTLHSVLYLMFNEGYHATETEGNDPGRIELAQEALRLGRELERLLTSLRSARSGTQSLVALMCYIHARRKARLSRAGDVVTLEKQDRSHWDRRLLDEAAERLRSVPWQRGAHNPYYLQAAINHEYCRAARFDMTDFGRICLRYAELYYLSPNPVVLLNWLIAESYRSDPQTALVLMEQHGLHEYLSDYRWFYAARAELRCRAGRVTGSMDDYRMAMSLCSNRAEARFIEQRVQELLARPG